MLSKARVERAFDCYKMNSQTHIERKRHVQSGGIIRDCGSGRFTAVPGDLRPLMLRVRFMF